jgi:hypothetical protein
MNYYLSFIKAFVKSKIIIGLCAVSSFVFADGLPVFTVQPANQNVVAGGTATFTVAAPGATVYQWRFNGADIPDATNSTLQVSGVQIVKCGYYMALAKNSTGWVPSQMVYLSLNGGGIVPFSNTANTGSFAQAWDSWTGEPVTNGIAQVVAGPALDQMQPVAGTAVVTNGYFSKIPGRIATVPTVVPGQTVYYRVGVTFTNFAGTQTQPSTVLSLVAGGDVYPSPSSSNLKFPRWPEWPEPWLEYTTPTNQVRAPGEIFTLTNQCFAYTDFGTPTAYWRKDGKPVPGGTNLTQISGDFFGGDYQSILTITNMQAADAGVYDLVVLGNNWIVGPKTVLSIQITNAPGVFRSPRIGGNQFSSDLLGVAGRSYTIEWSTDLADWHTLVTCSNLDGTISITNAVGPTGACFYRAKLLP